MHRRGYEILPSKSCFCFPLTLANFCQAVLVAVAPEEIGADALVLAVEQLRVSLSQRKRLISRLEENFDVIHQVGDLHFG